MIDIRNLTIKKARKHLDDKDFSARQLAEAYLEEISKVNTDLNAYLEVYKDVLEQADVADKKIAKGEIFVFTDSDSIVAPDAIEQAYRLQ